MAETPDGTVYYDKVAEAKHKFGAHFEPMFFPECGYCARKLARVAKRVEKTLAFQANRDAEREALMALTRVADAVGVA